MADSKYPPHIVKLFNPEFPISFLEVIDHPIETRTTTNLSGIGEFLNKATAHTNEFKNYKNEYVGKEQKFKLQAHQHLTNLQVSLVNWNPDKDIHVSGDPYKTVFVGRLDYNVNEIELSEKFSSFGEIEKVRVVRDKTDQTKSRGYAFIIYKNSSDAKTAFQKGNGMIINDRSVIVDIERGRGVKNWKPRRLGGGLGGRGYTKVPHSGMLKEGPTGFIHTQRTQNLAGSVSAIPRNPMFAPPRTYANSRHGGRAGTPYREYDERERDFRGGPARGGYRGGRGRGAGAGGNYRERDENYGDRSYRPRGPGY